MMELFHRPLDPGVGYWGERTSAVDWCESNYTWSFYIADFFNTITSLPAAFLAFHGVYLAFKYGYEKRMVVVNLLVALVGLGSAAFHGTLLYSGQIMDELPMVYTSLSLLYVVLEMEAKNKPIYKYLAPLIFGYSILFTGVYLYLPTFFIFFLIGYIFSILMLVYHCSIIYRNPTTLRHQRVLIVLSISFYIGGWLFFWIPEIAFCDTLKVFNFHAWWHVTSTLGAFVMVIFTVFQREIHRGRNPQLNYNRFLGVPILPYVHIPSEIENKKKDNNNNNKNVEVVSASSSVIKKKKSNLSNTR